MRKINLTVIVICLICFLASCGNLVPQENTTEEESIPSESETVTQEQTLNEQSENDGLELEEMSILMKIDDEIVTVAWEEGVKGSARKQGCDNYLGNNVINCRYFPPSDLKTDLLLSKRPDIFWCIFAPM